jgi:hypothetical protein
VIPGLQAHGEFGEAVSRSIGMYGLPVLCLLGPEYVYGGSKLLRSAYKYMSFGVASYPVRPESALPLLWQSRTLRIASHPYRLCHAFRKLECPTKIRVWFVLVGRDSTVSAATCWTVRGSNPSGVGGEIFRIRPERPWGLLNLLYKGYPECFPMVKQPGRGV